MVWPKTKITLRGDSHFSTPEVHDLCDGYGIDFILGQAINKKLKALGEPLMELAAALAEQTDEPVRLFDSFEYQANSWSRPRIIIYKAEITQGKANPRFVVTNIRDRTPAFLYETVYCARGRSEGFIKNHKTFLHSDRTSCHRFSANQFRLFLHSAAYVLLHTIQQLGLRGTQWTTSNFDTIQLRLPQDRRPSAGASHQGALSLSHLISAPGSDENGGPQPRYVVRLRDDANHIDAQAWPRGSDCPHYAQTESAHPVRTAKDQHTVKIR